MMTMHDLKEALHASMPLTHKPTHRSAKLDAALNEWFATGAHPKRYGMWLLAVS